MENVSCAVTVKQRPLKQIRKRYVSVNDSGEKDFARRSLRKTKSKKTVERWKVCVSEPFRNCEKIHPIQQKKVQFMINSLKDEANVQKIIIFGSSVTNQCHIGSDVDVYVCLHENKRLSIDVCDFVYDLWTNFTADPKMLDEILGKGVVVYERNIT